MIFRTGIWICGLLMASTVFVAPTPSTTTTPKQARASVADGPTDAKQPPQCSDKYFQYFPGLVDYCLGTRYWRKGNYHAGIEFLKLAASWASKDAQYSLGLIYYTGRHVPVDRARGIAWLELAAERHDPQTEKVAKAAARLAAVADRQRAQRLLSHMRLRYADKVAAKRAWERYKHRITYQKANARDPLNEGCTTRTDEPPGCISMKDRQDKLDFIASNYFDGWKGQVVVGPLKQVPAPASSSGN